MIAWFPISYFKLKYDSFWPLLQLNNFNLNAFQFIDFCTQKKAFPIKISDITFPLKMFIEMRRFISSKDFMRRRRRYCQLIHIFFSPRQIIKMQKKRQHTKSQSKVQRVIFGRWKWIFVMIIIAHSFLSPDMDTRMS